MNRYLTTYLLASTFLIGELHTFWEHSDAVSNWILFRTDTAMKISWNIKNIENQVNCIIYFLAWLLYKSNHVNKTTIKTFFVYYILDTLMYFINYKTHHYEMVYYLIALCWLIIYYFHKSKSNYS